MVLRRAFICRLVRCSLSGLFHTKKALRQGLTVLPQNTVNKVRLSQGKARCAGMGG